MRWVGVTIMVLVLAILVWGAGQVEIGSNYIWVSCVPGRVWRGDEAKLAEFAPPAGAQKTIIFLACRYRKTEDGMGMSDYPETFFYASAARRLGRLWVSVYPHPKVWQELSRDNLPKLVTELVVWELSSAGGKERVEAQETGRAASYVAPPVVTIVPRGAR